MAPRARVLPLTGTGDATLLVLAGGHSSRMGRPKSELPVGDVTILDWIVARLGASFAETIVAGTRAPRGVRAVSDGRVDTGPLAGIEAGLAAMRTPTAFVLACDMPRASLRLAALLLERCGDRDAAVPRVAGRAQPTCAAYARSALPKISAFLDGGGRRVTTALDALDVRYVDDDELRASGIPEAELTDLDTPEDYEIFLASLRP